MNLAERKEKFVQAWAALGSSWGINRTMALIHAHLLISEEDLSTEDLMQSLQISRGNANMNIRMLIDWGLVSRMYKTGDRKEYFKAEKDMWKVGMQIVKERRKRELTPIVELIQILKTNETTKSEASEQAESFDHFIENLDSVIQKADKTLEWLIKADQNRFVTQILKKLI